ncbi:MAG: haloacid dehalogenase-like hydrolase [bacterium]
MFKLKNNLIFLFFFFLFSFCLIAKDSKVKLAEIKKEPVKIKYAIFDVNGSFWKPHTSDIFNKILETQKVSFFDKLKMGGYFIAHKLGTINVKSAYESFLAKYKNKTIDDISKDCSLIWNDCCKDSIYKKSVDIFDEHKKNGLTTIIASATPEDVYNELLKFYKFDHVCATVLEKKDGIMTGKLVGSPCAAKDKTKIVTDLIEKKLGGSLKEVVFYARSQLDINLLKKVGKPVAFNPDPKLKSYAKIKGWEIIETKDLISAKLPNLLSLSG